MVNLLRLWASHSQNLWSEPELLIEVYTQYMLVFALGRGWTRALRAPYKRYTREPKVAWRPNSARRWNSAIDSILTQGRSGHIPDEEDFMITFSPVTYQSIMQRIKGHAHCWQPF